MTTMSSRLGLSISAGSVSIDCLIDTGACVSLLHKDIFSEICYASGHSTLLQQAPPIYTVSGKPITVYGCTEVEFGELGCLPVIIVEGIIHEGIIGNDILERGKAVVNYDTLTLKWKGKPFKLHPYGIPQAFDLAASLAVDGSPMSAAPGDYMEVLRKYQDVFYEDGHPFGQCPLKLG